MSPLLTDLQAHWPAIAPVFSISNEDEYEAAIERLNTLVDEVGTNEKHPLYSLLDTLGTIVHAYEQQQLMVPGVKGAEVLQSLMVEHDVSTSDLAQIGPPEQIEAYLECRQELTMDQVRALAERFRVSPAAFI